MRYTARLLDEPPLQAGHEHKGVVAFDFTGLGLDTVVTRDAACHHPVWCPRISLSLVSSGGGPRSSAPGLDLLQGLTAARELGQDRFYGGGPHERLRIGACGT